MFKPGDMVVHVRHGAGVVMETKTLSFEGEDREYFCIEMNGDRRTLMIPVENVDNDELRPAMTSIKLIKEILNEEPCALDENYRVRQTDIRLKLKTRSPLQLTEALRDLVYLERTHKLTTTDLRLRDQAMQALARELALDPSLSVAVARQNIQELIELAMVEHLAKFNAAAEAAAAEAAAAEAAAAEAAAAEVAAAELPPAEPPATTTTS